MWDSLFLERRELFVQLFPDAILASMCIAFTYRPVLRCVQMNTYIVRVSKTAIYSIFRRLGRLEKPKFCR